jgi:hypothetical protein
MRQGEIMPLLDRLPPWARDLVVAVAPGIIGWVASDVVPALRDQGGAAAVAAAVLASLVYTMTRIFTEQYGRGSSRSLARAIRHVSRTQRP